MRDPFHETAIPKKHPGFVIDDIVTGTIELGREHFFSHRHADRIGDALPQRPTRGCGGTLLAAAEPSAAEPSAAEPSAAEPSGAWP